MIFTRLKVEKINAGMRKRTVKEVLRVVPVTILSFNHMAVIGNNRHRQRRPLGQRYADRVSAV